MIPYFASDSRQFCLTIEVEQWRGTLFMRSSGGRARKGVASDCVAFVERVLVNVGAIKPIKWPRYVTFGGGETMGALLRSTIEAIPNVRTVWEVGQPQIEMMPGDILYRSVESDYHHLAIFLGDNAIAHMLAKRGMAFGNIQDPIINKNLKAIYRVYEN